MFVVKFHWLVWRIRSDNPSHEYIRMTTDQADLYCTHSDLAMTWLSGPRYWPSELWLVAATANWVVCCGATQLAVAATDTQFRRNEVSWYETKWVMWTFLYHRQSMNVDAERSHLQPPKYWLDKYMYTRWSGKTSEIQDHKHNVTDIMASKLGVKGIDPPV